VRCIGDKILKCYYSTKDKQKRKYARLFVSSMVLGELTSWSYALNVLEILHGFIFPLVLDRPLTTASITLADQTLNYLTFNKIHS
jgi:hypothetical protein